MNNRKNDLITWGKMLRKLPSIARALPRVIKGIKVANGGKPDEPAGLALLFEQAVTRNPDGPALLFGDVSLSYTQVSQRANAIAHTLIASGLVKGDVVAIFIENRPELLVTVLAVAKAGGVCAMLNTSQAHAPLIHSLNLVNPKAIVAGEELVEAYRAVREQVAIAPARTWFVADRNTFADVGEAPEDFINLMAASVDQPNHTPSTSLEVFAGDACFFMYTSGTTGLPKAGVFKHGRLIKTAANMGMIALDLKPTDVVYSTLPLYHATGLCVCWGGTLAGAAGFGPIPVHTTPPSLVMSASYAGTCSISQSTRRIATTRCAR
jgi:citronellyl-CoA synthetase